MCRSPSCSVFYGINHLNSPSPFVHFQKGLYEEALRCFETAIKIDGEYYDASRGKAFALLALERYHLALKEFQILTKRYSESFEFSMGKGLAQMGLRRHPEALKFLDRAIRLCPDNADAWQEKRKAAPENGQRGGG